MERKPPSGLQPSTRALGSKPNIPRAPMHSNKIELDLQITGSNNNKENAKVSIGGMRSLSQNNSGKQSTPKGSALAISGGIQMGLKPSQLNAPGPLPHRRGSLGGSANSVTGRKGRHQEEEKQGPALTAKGLYTEKPSDRFMKIKTADPFSGGKKHKTNFGYVYSAGGVPCRINHGTVTHKIHWDKSPQDLDYDPLLINCFEGLLETEHPYTFVANQALIELLEAPGATDKTIPLIPKLIMPLRTVFLSADPVIWNKGLNSLKLLAEAVGQHINSHIHILLAQLNKKMTLNKKVRESVMQVLNIIEEKGGKEALEVIKSKVPTYTSIYM